MERKLSTQKDVPVLIFTESEESREAFLSAWGTLDKGIKIEFCPSEREQRPLLLTNDDTYVGSGEIIDYLTNLVR